MAKPPTTIPQDPNELPPRIGLPVVLKLAGYSRPTLVSRIKSGRMPAAIDRGRDGGIWLRDPVLEALGIKDSKEPPAPERDPWAFDEGAFNAAMENASARGKAERLQAKLEKERAAKKAGHFPAKAKPRAKPVRIVPTEASDLGRYVVMKARSDGRYAVYFQVPKRLRPNGWRPTINLPIDEPRTGNMKDQAEVARIRRDTRELYASMTRERLAQLRQRLPRESGEE